MADTDLVVFNPGVAVDVVTIQIEREVNGVEMGLLSKQEPSR
mgnify:CR=1 FL=1